MSGVVVQLRPHRERKIVREYSIADRARVSISVTRARSLERMRALAAQGLCSECARPVSARESVVASAKLRVVVHATCAGGE